MLKLKAKEKWFVHMYIDEYKVSIRITQTVGYILSR